MGNCCSRGWSSEDLRNVVQRGLQGAQERESKLEGSERQPVTKEAAEFETLVLPAGEVGGILDAQFGAGETWVDVRQGVILPLLSGQGVLVRSETLQVVDPCPGVRKTLRVRYLTSEKMEFKLDTAKKQLTFEVIAPDRFIHIRDAVGVDNKGYFESICNLKPPSKQASGKSGELFFFTEDGRFVLKSVSYGELATLVGLLPPYNLYLRENQDSLLTRYLGAYSITHPDQGTMSFLVMNNVFMKSPKLDQMYDLKGTTEDRWVDPEKGGCMKDLNFAPITLHTADDTSEAIHKAIASDTAFLEARGIMDYSLMVGIAYIKQPDGAGEDSYVGDFRSLQRLAEAKEPTSPTSEAKEGPLVKSYSSLMGGLKAIAAQGVMADKSRDCFVFLGIVDMLVTYGLKKVAAHAIKSATIGLRNEIDTMPPQPYASRFRENFLRKIRGRCEHITLTPVEPESFETPFQPTSRSGGTAAFFHVKYKAKASDSEAQQSQEYWIGKDLARARDEVAFYEGSRKLRGTEGWELLEWLLPYRGVCRAPCMVEEKKSTPVDVLLLRNGRDGYKECRMLDIKIGIVTAVAGWQGKSSFAAWRQSCLDSLTNSSGQGSRLEGFDCPPASHTSAEVLALEESGGMKCFADAKKLKRFHLQRLTASEYLPLFVDLHKGHKGKQATALKEDASHLLRVETQELVLLSCIEELCSFLAACRKVPVPQQWIGSSVMLCFDSGSLPPKAARSHNSSSQKVARVQVFDWGRSELNTPQNHRRLSEEERTARSEHWGHYCGGVAKLLYDMCSLYVSRFWHVPKCLAVTLVDKDAYSEDDFIGFAAMPACNAPKANQVLRDLEGNKVKSGMILRKEATLGLSVDDFPLPEDSRLQEGLLVHVHTAANLPSMDVASASDGVAEIAALPQAMPEVEEALKTLGARALASVRESAHVTTLAKDTAAPIWEEEFQIAALKPAAREPFLKALGTAFGRADGVIKDTEVASLFPCHLGAGPDRDSLQRIFAQQCFPDLRIDQRQHVPLGFAKFPEDDELQLLHFGEWLQAEKHTQALVYVLFFMARAKGAKGTALDLRFGKAFVKVAGKKKWAKELHQALEAMKSGSEDAALSSQCSKELQNIAKAELRQHWTTYELQRQGEGFHCYEPLPPPKQEGPKEAEAKTSLDVFKFLRESAEGLVRTLQARRVEAGEGQAEAEAPAEEPVKKEATGNDDQSTPSSAGNVSERVARAMPLIIQAAYRDFLAAQGLLEAAKDTVGQEPLIGERQVERCAYVIPPGGCKYAPTPGKDSLRVEVFGANMLDALRRDVSGLSDQLWLDEVGSKRNPMKVLSTNSKSGEIFLISAQGRFIIKTVSDREAQALIDILPKYVEHIRGAAGSILGRYLGIYHIDVGLGQGKRYVTIMHSVFDVPVKMTSMYDLKGSTHHRSAKQDESVRKDEDWIADKRHFLISSAECERLAEMHKRDTDFLSSCKVMDYSLLVGVAPFDGRSTMPKGAFVSEDKSECYCIGIIDFLVEYGLKKQAEHALHWARGIGETASVTDPESYAKRQRCFVTEHILGPGTKSV